MSDKTYFTKEGYKSAMEELQLMKKRDRAELAEMIEEAREKGDLKENAEYKAAKEQQGLLEMKIARMESTLANAMIVDSKDIDSSKVAILCTVKLKNLNTNMVLTYTLVPEKEQDLSKSRLSISSPVAKGLVGKKPGEIAEIQAPAGLFRFEVLEITIE